MYVYFNFYMESKEKNCCLQIKCLVLWNALHCIYSTVTIPTANQQYFTGNFLGLVKCGGRDNTRGWGELGGRGGRKSLPRTVHVALCDIYNLCTVCAHCACMCV